MQRVLVLTQAGAQTGFGHLVRCLNIVDALDPALWQVEIAAGREAADHPLAQTSNHRFLSFGAADGFCDVDEGPAPALPASDWVLLDFFQHGPALETACRDARRKVFVIDGMLRAHDADILFDPIERPAALRQSKHQSAQRIIEGPTYAPISPGFASAVPLAQGPRLHLGVALGSATRTRDTDAVLQSLERLGFSGAVSVVGRVSPDIALSFDVTQIDWVTDGPGFLRGCNAVIGACGMSAWERCAARMPSLSFLTVENQVYVAQALETAKAGQVEHRPPHEMDEAALDAAITRFLAAQPQWQVFGDNGKTLCDGLGAARLAAALSAYPQNEVPT